MTSVSAYDIGEFSAAQNKVFEFVPPGSSVLELGANTGYMTSELLRQGCTVVAAEYDEAALAQLRTVHPDSHWVDLNDLQTAGMIRPGFDVVVIADVLEHLRDPHAVLTWAKGMLNPGGRIVVSLPNIAYWVVRFNLVFGRFDMTEAGILDRTHLHFFTHKSALATFTDAGLRVVEEYHSTYQFPFDHRMRAVPRVKARLNAIAARKWPNLFGYQIVSQLEVV